MKMMVAAGPAGDAQRRTSSIEHGRAAADDDDDEGCIAAAGGLVPCETPSDDRAARAIAFRLLQAAAAAAAAAGQNSRAGGCGNDEGCSPAAVPPSRTTMYSDEFVDSTGDGAAIVDASASTPGSTIRGHYSVNDSLSSSLSSGSAASEETEADCMVGVATVRDSVSPPSTSCSPTGLAAVIGAQPVRQQLNAAATQAAAVSPALAASRSAATLQSRQGYLAPKFDLATMHSDSVEAVGSTEGGTPAGIAACSGSSSSVADQPPVNLVDRAAVPSTAAAAAAVDVLSCSSGGCRSAQFAPDLVSGSLHRHGGSSGQRYLYESDSDNNRQFFDDRRLSHAQSNDYNSGSTLSFTRNIHELDGHQGTGAVGGAGNCSSAGLHPISGAAGGGGGVGGGVGSSVLHIVDAPWDRAPGHVASLVAYPPPPPALSAGACCRSAAQHGSCGPMAAVPSAQGGPSAAQLARPYVSATGVPLAYFGGGSTAGTLHDDSCSCCQGSGDGSWRGPLHPVNAGPAATMGSSNNVSCASAMRRSSTSYGGASSVGGGPYDVPWDRQFGAVPGAMSQSCFGAVPPIAQLPHHHHQPVHVQQHQHVEQLQQQQQPNFCEMHRSLGRGGTATVGTLTPSTAVRGGAYTLGSQHNYETPWDVASTAVCNRPHLPTSQPPPLPAGPETGRRPGTASGLYKSDDSSGVSLPQKQRRRRCCSWRCLGVSLMLIVVLLTAFVGYVIAMLLKGGLLFAADSSATSQTAEAVAASLAGERRVSVIPMADFVRLKFFVQRPAYYRLNVTVSPDAVVGVYMRRGAPPTHVVYDFFEPLLGEKVHGLVPSSTRTARSAAPQQQSAAAAAAAAASASTAFGKHVTPGDWFVSFFNDGKQQQTIAYHATLSGPVATECPSDCSGKGDCAQGTCRCYTGYTGFDCSQPACPRVCSDNGALEGGRCVCRAGWKGADCSVPQDRCEVPSCSGNGHCSRAGQCVCDVGWKGAACEERDCLDPTCSGRGACSQGRCYCELGYAGFDCSLNQTELLTAACRKDCSRHGTYDGGSKTCMCDLGWHGDNCEKRVCSVTCVHGVCDDGACECHAGWDGPLCNRIRCDNRCYAHGTCYNGTCSCGRGWNGRHCSLDGCPSDCNGRGACRLSPVADGETEWQCSCSPGWRGRGCEIALEQQCDDGIDDDGDSLIDCLDPDCCQSDICSRDPFCQPAPEPGDILVRKQQVEAASFFNSVRFLADVKDGTDGVQRAANVEAIVPWRAAVVRGHVVLADGTPLPGVRITVQQEQSLGFTVTRRNGEYDIIVNGGKVVTLSFFRRSCQDMTATVYVPCNEFVVLDRLTMPLTNGSAAALGIGGWSPGQQQQRKQAAAAVCHDVFHDRHVLRPRALSTWQYAQLRACPGCSAVMPESRVLQQSLPVPGTSVNLVHRSSSAAGYRSVVLLQLVGPGVPPGLELILLRVTVQGRTFEREFEADANLTYQFAWNRTNAYQQKVYGIVPATVAVGYKYKGCRQPYWEITTTQLSGFETTPADIGGWSLDVRHSYRHQEGVLSKGDGSSVYVSEQARRAATVLGDGEQRLDDCSDCRKSAAEARLFNPTSLAAGYDGSLYIGDNNLVRRLSPDLNTIVSLLRLRNAAVANLYSLAVSPVTGQLYLADPEQRRILRVKSGQLPSSSADLENNFDVVAGSGYSCRPSHSDRCGDGGLATAARLSFVGGLAINKYDELYFVDTNSIRAVGTDGLIRTVLGVRDQSQPYVPMPCNRAARPTEVHLRQPLQLAFNPLDDSLHILDAANDVVLKMSSEDDGAVTVVAGVLRHCDQPSLSDASRGLGLLEDEAALSALDAADSPLVKPKSIAFAPNGDLYIVESNGTVNRVRVVTPGGRIRHFAGGSVPCNCQMPGCNCFNEAEKIAAKASLFNPTAVTVSPDGTVYVADAGSLRIRSFSRILPQPNAAGGYEIVATDAQEVYQFDRFGHHVLTRDLLSREVLYNFTYSPRSSASAVLVEVTGRGGLRLNIVRDHERRPRELVVGGSGEGGTGGLTVAQVRLTLNKRLARYLVHGKLLASFMYNSTTGLLIMRQSSSGETFNFEYDAAGRLKKVVQPTGNTVLLSSTVEYGKAVVHLYDGAHALGYTTYSGDSLSLRYGDMRIDAAHSFDGSSVVEYPGGIAVVVQAASNPVIAATAGIVGSLVSVPTRRKIIAAKNSNIVHRIEWRYHYTGVRRGGNAAELSLAGGAAEGVRGSAPGAVAGSASAVSSRLRIGGSSSLGSSTAEHDTNGGAFNAAVAGMIRKDFVVNGDTLLSFEYVSADSRTERILDRTGNPLLLVHYGLTGLPEFLAAASVDTENVSIAYLPDGRPSRWQRGTLTETWAYDQLNNIVSRTIGGGSQAMVHRYEYTGGMLTSVIIPSGATYRFLYDGGNYLSACIMPGRSQHRFATMYTLGFVRHKYWFENINGHSPGTFIEDYSAAGNLMRRIYPSGSRSSYYRYSADGRLLEVLFDDKLVTFHRDPENGTATSVVLRHALYSASHSFETSGLLTLTEAQSFRSTVQSLSLANVSLRYEYDRLLQVAVIRGSLTAVASDNGGSDSSHPLREHELHVTYSYEPGTGRLAQVSNFTITRAPPASVGSGSQRTPLRLTVANGPLVTYVRSRDGYGRLELIEVQREETYTLYTGRASYDAAGRLRTWQTTGIVSTTVEYAYDSDSRVTRVVEDSGGGRRTTTAYEYDVNGNIVALGVGRTHRVNERDQTERFDGEDYRYDDDGFLVARGHTRYEYDSLGRLTHVYKPGVLDVGYFYDAEGRLALRRDGYGRATHQLVYAHPRRRCELTHVYSHADDSLTALHYLNDDEDSDDGSGPLIAMSRDGTRYLVITGPTNAPIAVFDSQGTLVKELRYSLWGKVESDTDTRFFIPLGFRGAYYDVEAGLAHTCNGRVYDTELGRWLSNDLPSVVRTARTWGRDPRLANLYQLPDPLLPSDASTDGVVQKATDLTNWLYLMGYNMATLAPKTTFEGLLEDGETPQPLFSQRRTLQTERQPPLLPLMTSFQCAYDLDMLRFDELQSAPVAKPAGGGGVPPLLGLSDDHGSKVHSRGSVAPSPTFARLPSLLGDGLMSSELAEAAAAEGLWRPSAVASTSTLNPAAGLSDAAMSPSASGAAVSQSTAAANRERQLLSVVLAGARPTGLNYTLHGKLVYYLVKEDADALRDDLTRLSMPGGGASPFHISSTVYVEVTRIQVREPSAGGAAAMRQQADLVITGNATIVSVRYGARVAEERARVLALALGRAESTAWTLEHAAATARRPSRGNGGMLGSGHRRHYTWSDAEAQELLRTGRVSGYAAQPLRDPAAYPELADDPNNVVFIRKGGVV